MIATAFKAKMMTGSKPAASTAIPAGTKIRRTLTQLWHKAVLVWPTKRIEPFFIRTNRAGFSPCWGGCFSLALLLSSGLGPGTAASGVAAVGARTEGFTWAC